MLEVEQSFRSSFRIQCGPIYSPYLATTGAVYKPYPHHRCGLQTLPPHLLHSWNILGHYGTNKHNYIITTLPRTTENGPTVPQRSLPPKMYRSLLHSDVRQMAFVSRSIRTVGMDFALRSKIALVFTGTRDRRYGRAYTLRSMALRDLRCLQMKSLKQSCNSKHAIFPIHFVVPSEERGGGEIIPNSRESWTTSAECKI